MSQLIKSVVLKWMQEYDNAYTINSWFSRFSFKGFNTGV